MRYGYSIPPPYSIYHSESDIYILQWYYDSHMVFYWLHLLYQNMVTTWINSHWRHLYHPPSHYRYSLYYELYMKWRDSDRECEHICSLSTSSSTDSFSLSIIRIDILQWYYDAHMVLDQRYKLYDSMGIDAHMMSIYYTSTYVKHDLHDEL
jgi:hypothetical protein